MDKDQTSALTTESEDAEETSVHYVRRYNYKGYAFENIMTRIDD